MTLVDSNVVLDVVAGGQPWVHWSRRQLERAVLEGPLYINHVIYSEISTRYATVDAVDSLLLEMQIEVVPMSRHALFLAGKTLLQYRAAGGVRTGVLSDFFIGAHAVTENLPLLTRDVRRYRNYFPTVMLIVPESEG